ncbi:MAG TPA: hypothetical protein VFM07_06035 [Intrasporangium sp.]|nr:hypothetical protein [Intrasporangium sp.]
MGTFNTVHAGPVPLPGVGGRWDGFAMTTGQGPAGPEQLMEQFAQYVAEGDVAGIVGLYAADAVVSLRDGREVVGSDQIGAAFVAALARGLDVAVEPAGTPIVRNGVACTSTRTADDRVCTQVARQAPDGSWQWLRDGFRLRDVAIEEVVLPGRDVA